MSASVTGRLEAADAAGPEVSEVASHALRLRSVVQDVVNTLSTSHILRELGFRTYARLALSEALHKLTFLVTYLSTGRYVEGLASELDDILAQDALRNIRDEELKDMLEAATLLRDSTADPNVKQAALNRVKQLLSKALGNRLTGPAVQAVIENGGAEELAQAVATFLAIIFNKMEG